MKIRAVCFSLLSLVILAGNYGRAAAAGCVNATKAGVVTVNIPNLPNAGTYNIWTRMQVPDAAHNRYQLEINGQSCYLVGGSSITPGQWTWVSFQNGVLSSKVSFDFPKSNGNRLRLIGYDAGVKVERLVLVKGSCVPIGLGDNCQTDSAAINPTHMSGALVLPPPSNGPVSGIIIPSATISQNPGTVAKVIYFADGKPVPTAPNYGLDTTLLGNGSHQISMQITKTDASISNQSVTLIVENPQNSFSPFRRWVRLNQQLAVKLSTFIGIILLITIILLVIRHIKLQKRLLHFHGF